MKFLILSIFLIFQSQNIFADILDLAIFNSLIKAGIQTEQFMSKVHIEVNQMECQTNTWGKLEYFYQCKLLDVYAKNGNGQELIINGKNARDIYKSLLNKNIAHSRIKNKIFFNLNNLKCIQILADVLDETEEQRTNCKLE